MSEYVIPGKRYIEVISVGVLLLGIAEVIASIAILASSSGYFMGGWYLGFGSILAGGRGVRLYVHNNLYWVLALSILAMILSIVGGALLAAEYNFLETLEACAQYTGDFSTSCSVNSNAQTLYECSGNNQYYLFSLICAQSSGNTDPNDCTCVTDTDSGECYGYSNIYSCSNLLNVVPGQLQATYALAVVLVLLNVALIALASLSIWFPDVVSSKAERDALSERVIAAEATATVTSSAPSAPTALAHIQPSPAGAVGSTGSGAQMGTIAAAPYSPPGATHNPVYANSHSGSNA